MEKRTLGRTGMQVTALGYGGAEIGFQKADQDTVRTLLNAALDAGLNVIDTGECYHGSEEMIGNTVSHRRHEYFLFSKCGHGGKDFGLADWDPKLLELTIERSLKRLKTDRLDLLQVHSCSLEMLQKGEVIAVVEKAKKAGKTRFIGYSGDGAAARYAVECGRFDTLQTSCSIADQESIELSIPLAKERHMGVICKRPVANVAWHSKGTYLGGYDKAYYERLQALKYDFLEGPLADAVSTALRFTLSVPGVTTAIVGTKTPERWRQNAELLKAGPLPAGQFEMIRKRWGEVAQDDWVGLT